jgi:hypothetical protein
VTTELSAEEKREVEKLEFGYKHVAYAIMMASRPQTMTGSVDSPVGLAAFMADHDRFARWPPTASSGEEPCGVSPW